MAGCKKRPAFYLDRFINFDGVNFTTFLSGITTDFFSHRSYPLRSFRTCTENVPNPIILTGSSFFIVLKTVPRTTFITLCTSVCDIPVSTEVILINSLLSITIHIS